MGSTLFVAIFIGVAIAVQVAVLGRVAGALGAPAVALLLQVGGLVAGVIWATALGGWTGVVSGVASWWWLPLGAVGWGILVALGHASSRLGVAVTLAVSVAAQLGTGLALDARAGSLYLDSGRLVGVALLVVGVYLVART